MEKKINNIIDSVKEILKQSPKHDHFQIINDISKKLSDLLKDEHIHLPEPEDRKDSPHHYTNRLD